MSPNSLPSSPSASHAQTREFALLRRLTQLLDSEFRIPGTQFRIGLDAIAGLIPGLGDALGTAFSAYLIHLAARQGAPKALLARMVVNVGVDAIVGVVPVVGDLFDVAWRANVRNLRLLDTHLNQPHSSAKHNRQFLIAAFCGLLFVLGITGYVGFSVLHWVLRQLANL